MFENIQGLAPERAAQRTALVQQCRPLLDQGKGMDDVQRLLQNLGVGVMDAIVVTRELLGAGPGHLGQAKMIVLGSPGRSDALRVHQQLMDTLERAQDIAEAVCNLLGTERATALVGIDGPGGSGKTTLAAAVAEHLNSARIVHGDGFYRPMPDHEREQLSARQGYHRYFDWERLRDQVLAPLRAGQTVRYQGFDWATGQLGAWHEITPATVVIVEGVYSVRPELAPYYHLTTWVETQRETCLRRLRARGQNTEEWIKRWRAAEDYYIRATWPQTRVNLRVSGD